jgi:hypothetical protein
VNQWKVILATMVIFGAGVVTGGLMVRHGEHRGFRSPPRNGVSANRPPQVGAPASLPVTPGILRIEFLKRMGRELDLSPEQRERVDKILKESQDRTRNLMDPIAPQLRAEVIRTKEQFRAALTPEQQVRFDELLKLQQMQQKQQQQQHPRDGRRPQSTSDRPPTNFSPVAAPAVTN